MSTNMVHNWTNAETFQFIETYQNEPVIWNPQHEQHKDRNKVNDAWIRISNIIGIPAAELKKKKETLMTAFRTHLKKKKASIRSGAGVDEVYKPIWVFYDAMEVFLRDIYECASVMNTQNRVLEQDSQTEEEQDNITVQSRRSDNEKADSVTTPNTPVNTPSTPVPAPNTPNIPVQRRRSANPPELQQANKQMKHALNTLDSILTNKQENKEDDCDLYGRLVAKKLRQYSDNERQEIMYDIDGLLLNRRRRYLSLPSSSSQIQFPNRPSSSFTAPCSPSPNDSSSTYSTYAPPSPSASTSLGSLSSQVQIHNVPSPQIFSKYIQQSHPNQSSDVTTLIPNHSTQISQTTAESHDILYEAYIDANLDTQ